MNVRLTQAFALCLLLIGSHALAESPSCVLPVADGGVKNPSSPSMKGVINSVEPGQITLQGKVSHPISISEDTHMFTIYGGIVLPNDVKKGQHVLVWFVNCGESQKQEAAVIEFCSKENESCPE